MHRSSNATGPRCAGGRWPSADGPEGRGVVAAASYEAREFGVRSALSMARALRLCPELVVVPPDFHKYRDVSRQVFDLFRAVTPARRAAVAGRGVPST